MAVPTFLVSKVWVNDAGVGAGEGAGGDRGHAPGSGGGVVDLGVVAAVTVIERATMVKFAGTKVIV